MSQKTDKIKEPENKKTMYNTSRFDSVFAIKILPTTSFVCLAPLLAFEHIDLCYYSPKVQYQMR